ncbi:MAG: ParA family protein [Saprospiraceae bacterium]|nr:ParA family protein [Saprospiraceae bacterium]
MRVITLCNEKGGTAKTTTAVNLAHGIALKGKRVLLVDLDGQGQATTCLGLEQEPGVFDLLIGEKPAALAIRPTGRDNLFIIPGNKRTQTALKVIAAEGRQVEYLQERLKGANYDYLIFDTAPSINDLTGMALYMSNYYLIPSACDYLSSEGIYKLQDLIKDLKAKVNFSAALLGIIPTFYDGVSKESQANIDTLKKDFGDKVLAPVHRATILREAPAFGKTIFEYSKSSRAAEEYQAIVNYVLEATK